MKYRYFLNINILSIVIYSIVAGFLFGFFFWKVPLLLTTLLSVSIASYLLSLINVFDSVGSLLGGIVSSRYNYRYAIIIGSIVFLFGIIFYIVYEFIDNIFFLLLSSILLLGLTSIMQPAIKAALADATPSGYFGRMLAAVMVLSRVGRAVGSTVLGIMSRAMRSFTLLAGAVTIVLSSVIMKSNLKIQNLSLNSSNISNNIIKENYKQYINTVIIIFAISMLNSLVHSMIWILHSYLPVQGYRCQRESCRSELHLSIRRASTEHNGWRIFFRYTWGTVDNKCREPYVLCNYSSYPSFQQSRIGRGFIGYAFWNYLWPVRYGSKRCCDGNYRDKVACKGLWDARCHRFINLYCWSTAGWYGICTGCGNALLHSFTDFLNLFHIKSYY